MIEIYLNFDGNCREVVEFYAQVFNTELQPVMTFGDAPDNPEFPLDEEAKHRVMHTFLMIGNNRVMFSDIDKGAPFVQGNNFSIAYTGETETEIRNIFSQLSGGGEVLVDLQETFFSKLYGMVRDKFGITWQLLVRTEH